METREPTTNRHAWGQGLACLPLESRGAGSPPAPSLLWSDGTRAAWELSTTAALSPWWTMAPDGDGHPVLVLPGLWTGDGYTAPLRGLLGAKGYPAYGWGAGINLGRWAALDEVVLPRLRELHRRHGRPLSLVGASMGGLLARAAAARAPQWVRQVITLGSAIADPDRSNHVWPLYQATTGQPAETLAHPLPPVPSTSVWSVLDGLSHWRPCVPQPRPQAEQVGVFSSHHGLVHHPAVLWLIADRLAQAEEGWRPFEPPAWARALYLRAC